jgi:hypothetical protein
MAKTQPPRGIPVELRGAQFDEIVLPHLTRGHHGPMPKFPLRKIFNYIVKLFYLGCQRKALPIEGSGWSPRSSSHERLPHFPAMDSRWLSRLHTARFGMQTA